MTTVSQSPQQSSGVRKLQRWTQCLLVMGLAIAFGISVLPLVRSKPELVHKYVNGLHAWERISIAFALAVVVAYLFFALFSPRLSHLRHLSTQPPLWFAWLYGIVCVAALDLNFGLSPKHYTASYTDWIVYCGVPIALVWLYRRLFENAESQRQTVGGVDDQTPPSGWESLEAWLRRDAPADQDFLGGRVVARRMNEMLRAGTRSIGIVGPYGAGKTSIVEWLTEMVVIDSAEKEHLLLISSHSCWGFETSASAIQTILDGGLKTVGERIDTFDLRSLPDSYRQTFSAAGKWVDELSKLVFRRRDPVVQFRSLSDLLGAMDARLVFVVEDLDRNNSRTFDIQEVLAFLQQLKDFSNFAFILTGGHKAPARIDFAKLCDHIEYLRPLSVQQAGELVATLRERCLSRGVFPHEYLTDPADNQWNPLRWMLLSDRDEIHPPEAIARLLDTPRALRHALGRTYRAWQALYGEIDWDHLLALNVLRCAAPEAFTFVLNHWHRLNARPSSYTQQHGQLEQVRVSLRREWDAASAEAEWDGRAARTLIDLILPAAPIWLDDAQHVDQPCPQGLHGERYWQRALAEEIGPDEVRDQTVICEMREWIDLPLADSRLVNGLCSSSAYSDVWEDLAYRYFSNDRNRLLMLCQHVFRHICQKDGAAAASDSQGFIAVWRYGNRHVERVEDNRQWLEERISEAAMSSLELVNSLWHYFGAGQYSILRTEDREPVRSHLIQALQRSLTNAESLASVVHPKYRYVFYQLVFDPGEHQPILTGVESWGWLGPILLEGLRSRNATIAIGVASLIAAREEHSHIQPSVVNPVLLTGFFGDNSSEAIEAIEVVADQVDENDRGFLRDIVRSGRSALGSEGSLGESE